MSTQIKRTEAVPEGTQAVRAFLKRAAAGDETTLPVLRQMLELPSFLDSLGNLARHAEDSLIRNTSGKDLAVREGLTQKAEAMRAELAGPNAMPLERLLVERVVACWLQVNDADIRFSQLGSVALAVGEYHQRRIDRAHRRFLSAVKSLAIVRKLAMPVLVAQVNLAHNQQFNTSLTASPSDPEG